MEGDSFRKTLDCKKYKSYIFLSDNDGDVRDNGGDTDNNDDDVGWR